MSDVVKGGPPSNNRSKNTAFNHSIVEMLELAIADKGEWYSIPIPEDHAKRATGGVASTAAGFVGRRVADISTRNGRLWLRIKP